MEMVFLIPTLGHYRVIAATVVDARGIPAGGAGGRSITVETRMRLKEAATRLQSKARRSGPGPPRGILMGGGREQSVG